MIFTVISYPHELLRTDIYTFVKIIFLNSKVKEVPTWMFLAWLNQIVALFDKTKEVLSIIATDYPQALTYPLRISSNMFSFDDSPEGMQNKDEYQRYFYIYYHVTLIVMNELHNLSGDFLIKHLILQSSYIGILS